MRRKWLLTLVGVSIHVMLNLTIKLCPLLLPMLVLKVHSCHPITPTGIILRAS